MDENRAYKHFYFNFWNLDVTLSFSRTFLSPSEYFTNPYHAENDFMFYLIAYNHVELCCSHPKMEKIRKMDNGLTHSFYLKIKIIIHLN